MNKILLSTLTAFIIALALACSKTESSVDEQDGLSAFSQDSLIKHIVKLSSDEFQGRRPFTIGETRTVEYLTQTLRNMGVEPGNGSEYFQKVPMVEITPTCDPAMLVNTGKGNFSLKNMEDYVIWTENTDSVVSVEKSDVVFAGFGVVAPEYNWNDYQGLDVKGKFVLVMVNDPGFSTGDTTLFKGKEMTYYGRWTYKFEEAARQGAKGCLIVHNEKAASYPFSVVQNSWGKSQQHLDTRGSKEYRCPVEGWITEAAAKKLLNTVSNGEALLVKANQKGFKPVALPAKVSTSMKVKAVFNESKNVIGKITGSKRPNEYIIYSAHWDHFGIGKPDAKGDSIYNGALDNASGTAAVLEIARAFKSLKNKPERSIVFLFVTGEEQGLLGSAYYAQHPVFPANETVGNLNIDVINNFGRTKDISIAGEGQSELEDYLKKEVESKGRYIAPEAHPEAGHYFRSDHFSFAKAGIPALTTGSGIDEVAKGKEYGQKQQELYTEKFYHQTTDQYDAATWKLEGGLEDTILLFQIGKRLAFETTWPQWKEGSEFKALRKK
ncbi:M28 family metallopeptidase [Emticicia sp. 21SJ11W-3]|uniref:M28 family metallopeptidase n=1 Tax=Emticicia sp. 21SJ11W-3 TaxID=2916755 RepID=UPI00209D9F55|nr:M28 family metallopeptidase [Emticicia sp. 21SJ11W-3]UTA69687.1 M28 family metallopeptidase [Emticicia sp. 21SJ11W-3]